MRHRPKLFEEIVSLFSASCPSANCLFGKMPVRQNVRSAKRPFGKTSVRQNVRRQNVLSAKCLSAKCLSAKCLSANCLSAKCPGTHLAQHSLSEFYKSHSHYSRGNIGMKSPQYVRLPVTLTLTMQNYALTINLID